MKILLTGKPKSGKTTLLRKLLETVENKRGVVAVEVLEHGQRIGFDLQDNFGHTAVLARTGQETDIAVAKYFVNVASLDTFITPLSDFAPDQLLYIDEIGHMQLYSEKFQKLVQLYLNATNDYLGTVSSIYDHPFIDEIKNRKDVLLCAVIPENRDAMLTILSAALKHRAIFDSLPINAQAKTLSLARGYLKTACYISLGKLFNNAIIYVARGRIKTIAPNTFVVHGNHDDHQVVCHSKQYSCDCDFFNGRGKYAGSAGECSHIQAVKILFSLTNN